MSRDIDPLTAYCEQLSSPPSLLLQELLRETHLKTLAPQMISGPLQGQLLSLLSQLKQPRKILEIGTFTAYATICLAKGLTKGGILHTIEANPELEYLIRKYLKKAELENRVQLHIGKAENIIPNLGNDFDMVFLDAGKLDYAMFYDLVIEKTTPGGLILADNVLWSGKVIKSRKDKDTRALHAFNEMVKQDSRVENLILPVRDGLLIAQKN